MSARVAASAISPPFSPGPLAAYSPAVEQPISGTPPRNGRGHRVERAARGLLELGCRLGQGFLFARPADAETIDALLGERRAPGASELPEPRAKRSGDPI